MERLELQHLDVRPSKRERHAVHLDACVGRLHVNRSRAWPVSRRLEAPQLSCACDSELAATKALEQQRASKLDSKPTLGWERGVKGDVPAGPRKSLPRRPASRERQSRHDQ